MLMSCQENGKAKLQDLIDQKDFVNAKVIAEERLGQNPQDDYYNGVMGYILSVECLSTNCPQNKPENLKKIKYYLNKSNGLSKVGDAYFIDFYQLIMQNIITVATQQETLAQARLTLKEFVNSTNPRIAYIYKHIYKNALSELLNENFEKSSLNLELLQEFNFKLTEEQKLSIDLLLAFEKNTPIRAMRAKIKSFNRVFIGSKLPDEFLTALAPAIVEYAINHKVDSVITILENSIKARSTILGENVAVLRQESNVKAYAKGVELVSKSEKVIQHLEDLYNNDKSYFVNSLQNISLKLNPENPDLWKEYLANVLQANEITDLYKNINIEQLPSTVVIANNDQLLIAAEKLIEKQSVTPILNEIVFRDDSNGAVYTQKTIQLVEKALKIEISKNNLDGIFEYLNYVPSIKSKFKDELNQRLSEYIDIAWAKNNFENLNKLINLHKDLNDISDNSILLKLFEDYLLAANSVEFFKANDISSLIKEGSDDLDVNHDMSAKYDFVIGNLKNAEIQTTLFSTARKMEGLYTQSKLFTFFIEVFSKDKVDDLIIDSVASALAKDQNKQLLDLIKLSGFLINKTNKIPENYIADEIIPRFENIEDIKSAWENSSAKTKEHLVSYNIDIKYLIKVIANDKANKKITAAKYIGKIKSKEILPFVANYAKIYKSYISQIKGFYIKEDSKKGPEIIKISATKDLLKIKVDFISRLGKIENLDKYKLDRGEVISKEFTTYYNPVTSDVSLKGNYKSKELKVFVKGRKMLLDGAYLAIKGQKYHKIKDLFVFNKRYGVVEQITEKTQDNFHILPEGSSFSVTEEVSKNLYKIALKHPAVSKTIETNAKYNPLTAEFAFEYDYYIKLFDKTFSAKAKCQLIDTAAYCAVQDKYWKRQEYSVILKALEVK